MDQLRLIRLLSRLTQITSCRWNIRKTQQDPGGFQVACFIQQVAGSAAS